MLVDREPACLLIVLRERSSNALVVGQHLLQHVIVWCHVNLVIMLFHYPLSFRCEKFKRFLEKIYYRKGFANVLSGVSAQLDVNIFRCKEERLPGTCFR